MGMRLKIGDIEDVYCVDCKNFRYQKYKGKLADGSLFFLCRDCGCENTIEKHEKEYQDLKGWE